MTHRRFWLACGYGFVVLVVYLSLTPEPVSTPNIDEVKSGHLLAYAWLMWWFAQLVAPRPARIKLATLLVLLGIGLEYAQGMTEHRTFAYSDMRDNTFGVIAGWIVALTPAGRVLAALDRAWTRHNSPRA
jgi:hypothetical protein